MICFVNDFLDLGESVGKATQLVRALVDLIQQDKTIGNSEAFFNQIGWPENEKGRAWRSNRCLPSFFSA